MLHMILLECALELVPSEISALKQIQKHAARRGKKPIEILLDQSHHGREMTRLENSLQRGRPDIVFHSLISLLETPLCKSGNLTIHLHLQDGRIVEINPEVRLPRNYDRFVGLIEQLLLKGQVPVEGDPLLRITKKSLSDTITELKKNNQNAQSILAIENGSKTSIDRLQALFPNDASIPVIVGVGAFPHGNLSQEVLNLFQTQLELDIEVMMAWHVCAEVLWTYSSSISVIQSRYSST
ncbi:MAG: 16S rRNA methyltransferase [Candidatus Thorarchaeota archaeon]|nr:MAG: 16S rRNA methyltransferase [Candidatus Thorarchaeota archaeon]